MSEDSNSPIIAIGEKQLGQDHPCYIIAEIGINFNGELDLAKRSIDTAAACGADAVKFQTFHAEEFVADKTLTHTYTNAKGEEETVSQFELFKQTELPDDWHALLATHAKENNVDFLSSVADRSAVDLLSSLNVPALKLASEDLINELLLEYAASQGIPLILSTGMADESEIARALDIVSSNGAPPHCLLHCVSSYPTPADQCNLRRITALKERFNCVVGYSDHTLGWEAAMLSVGLGAAIVEKHFTLDKTLPGPDHSMSADPQELDTMVRMIRQAETLRGSGGLSYAPVEEEGRTAFRRSIVAACNIKKGERIQGKMLGFKRPGHGLKPIERSNIIGKCSARDIAENEMISMSDVEDPGSSK